MVSHRVVFASFLLASLSGVALLAQLSSPDASRGRMLSSVQSDSDSINDLEVTVREMNGQPVPNLRLEIHSERNGTSVASGATGVQGSIEFQNLPRGEYEVVAFRGAAEVRERLDYSGGSEGLLLRLPAPPADAAGNGATVSIAQMKVPAKAQKELQKARERMERNQPAEARTAALKALEIFPQYAEAHTILGILDLYNNDVHSAVGELEKAAALDPNSVLSLAALGAAYNAEKRFDDAFRPLQSALRLEPNSWQANLEMAKACLGKNEFAASLHSIQLAIPLVPPGYSSSQAHLLRADALLGLKQYGEAIGEYELYLRQEPKGPEATQVRAALDQARTLAGNRP
jgi:tetratricopeptide (TPR) repeat protein